MNSGEEFGIREALGEIGRVGGKVRRSARWGPSYFLALGTATAAYWVITHFVGGPFATIANVGWLVFCAVSVLSICRNRVYDRVTWRLQWAVTGLFLAGTVFNLWMMRYVQEGEGAGPVLAGVTGIVFTAAAPLYGAWRGMTALEDRTGPIADR